MEAYRKFRIYKLAHNFKLLLKDFFLLEQEHLFSLVTLLKYSILKIKKKIVNHQCFSFDTHFELNAFCLETRE